MKKLLVLGWMMVAVSAAVFAATLDSQWKGKKVAILGDSISDPHVCASNYYVYLEKDLGIVPYVYAVNGHQWKAIKGQAEKLKAEHGEDVDAILIFVGTNDYSANTPLGQWWTYTMEESGWWGSKELAPRRNFVMSPDTFRGRINIAMSYLKENFPDAQIVLMTPIHRGYANFHYGNNIQSEETFGNARGLHIEDYVNVVKEASGVWSVPVIDLYAEGGLFPIKDAYAKYFKSATDDRLHPNALGHWRLAEVIKYRLLGMSAGFRK